MTACRERHADYGAEFETQGGREIVAHYGRPERTHLAVRNGVGVIEMGYGVVVIEGDDRVEFVDDTVSNRVPTDDGSGCYAFLLDPQGGVETDCYLYNADERLLAFTPPDRSAPLAADWREKVFIQDVSVREASADFGVFGVHGPSATETVAGVLGDAPVPDDPLSFVRGSVGGAGATVVTTDAPAGEEGYEVVCAAGDADEVFDTLLTRGTPTTPVGYRTWNTLTLEAGTPRFESELVGRIPNVAGARHALDFEKGCYVGQEVVSRVENRGRPSERLVGLEMRPGSGDDAVVPDATAAVVSGDESVGEVTRAARSPCLDRPIALGYVEFGAAGGALAVRVDGEDVPARVVDLPFVEGSARSARLPRYDSD
jgi:aminomethyltransferase